MDGFSVRKLLGTMVRPSEPTPSGSLNLSVIDKAPELRHHVRVLFVFKYGNEKSAEVIKEAVSKALVPYYPLAGRLQEPSTGGGGGGGGELHIFCTGEGVWFIESYAECTLADVNYIDDAPLHIQEKLLPDSIPEVMTQDPIVLIQMTRFKCEGFVLGLIFSHSVCDGVGASQFLNAVGEFARGLDRPSIDPVWLRNQVIPSPSTERLTPAPVPPPPPLMPHYQLKYAIFDMPADKIDQLKRHFSNLIGKACSTFEVLTAGLWRSRTRAIINLPNRSSMVKLVFYADIRRLLNPPAPPGFYGNCIFPITVTVPGKWLVKASLVEVVQVIKEGKAKLPSCMNKWINCSSEGGRAHEDVDDDLIILDDEPYNTPFDYATLCVSDGGRLGLDSINFGWGEPLHAFLAGLSPTMKMHPFCLLWAPPKPKTGIRLRTWCVEESHLPSLQYELTKMVE